MATKAKKARRKPSRARKGASARGAARKSAKKTSARRGARKSTARKSAAKRSPARKRQSPVARVKRVAREVAQQATVAVSAGVETLKDFGGTIVDRVRQD